MIKNNDNSKKKQESWTPVPDRMLESWSLSPFFNNTVRVYFVIYRLTIGYNREWFQISRKDFQKRTGMHNDDISRSLQKLEQGKFICRNRHTQKPNYMINQHFTTWEKSKNTSGEVYMSKRSYNYMRKPSYKQKDPSYSMVLKKKKERKKPFSFSDLEKSKDKIERDFFELFKDYPEKTNCKKALEIFRRDVDHPGGIDKIKIALECYLKKKKKTKQYPHGLGNWMDDWIAYYDMGKHDAECNKAAAVKQKEADIEAAAELKRIKNLPEISTKAMDKDLKKRAPVVWASIQANKKRRKIGQCKKTPSIKGKAKH